MLYRWPAWNPDDGPGVLDDLQALREMGLGIKFFFPKWSSSGYAPERGRPTTARSGWQSLLLETPVPGGWETLVGLADAVHERGCSIQGFIAPRSQEPEGPDYDEDRWPRVADGQPIHDLSAHDAVDRLSRGLDNLAARGLKLDTLYFDGYAAFGALAEDFSPHHPVTRRMTYEAQNAAFAETRRRGIVPAGELARFWCIADCDYFFFTDWSSDRLANTPVQGAPAPVGEPVPLFQLVFHDCFFGRLLRRRLRALLGRLRLVGRAHAAAVRTAVCRGAGVQLAARWRGAAWRLGARSAAEEAELAAALARLLPRDCHLGVGRA